MQKKRDEIAGELEKQKLAEDKSMMEERKRRILEQREKLQEQKRQEREEQLMLHEKIEVLSFLSRTKKLKLAK